MRPSYRPLSSPSSYKRPQVTYSCSKPMMMLCCGNDRPYHEHKTWDLCVIEKTEEPGNGKGGEDDSFWTGREQRRGRPYSLMITQQPRQQERKRKQSQHRRQSQHSEVTLEQEHPLHKQTHHISRKRHRISFLRSALSRPHSPGGVVIFGSQVVNWPWQYACACEIWKGSS
jgi:hypothetical protein